MLEKICFQRGFVCLRFLKHFIYKEKNGAPKLKSVQICRCCEVSIRPSFFEFRPVVFLNRTIRVLTRSFLFLWVRLSVLWPSPSHFFLSWSFSILTHPFQFIESVHPFLSRSFHVLTHPFSFFEIGFFLFWHSLSNLFS